MPEIRNIAVAGGTGRVGRNIVESLLSPEFRSSFGEVVLLTRERGPTAIELEKKGATIRLYNEENMASSLEGVDVLVNALASKGHHYKLKIIEALPTSSVKLYFPSEFGVDHYGHMFPQEMWDTKKDMYRAVQKAAPNTKVCLVFIGLFLELSFGPWFGFDTKNARYTCVGSATTPASYTSMADTGKIVAALASLPYGKVPEFARFGGDTISCAEIAKVMKDNGGPEIQIEELDLGEFKKRVLEENGLMPAEHIRFVMGEGGIDHRVEGMGSDVDLVNEGEKRWKWKRVGNYAAEVKGRPFV
ncbi:isoflavone reductase family protein [Leptodontidium sp. 2 PMI_412]|nr:isoflavone reductase family protein [Leptodontidium sp. 2 PMI_412]